MSDFVKLSQIAKLTVGYVGSMASEYRTNGIPFLRSLNIKPFDIDENDMKFVSADFNKRNSKSILHEKEIVIVRTGVPGTCCVVPKEFDGCNCSDVVIVRPDEDLIDPYYLAAYINFLGQKQISNNKVGAVQKHFNVHSAEEMMIYLPERLKQKKIAEMLVCITKKIKLNKKINDNLQQQLKILYDYWFTQFEFPNEEGKPYKSSGGFMVWNDELKREIPEGWTVKMISDLMEISNIKIKPSEIGERIYAPIEVIPKNRMSFYETAPINKAATGLCKFDSKSILLSNRRVYFHKVCISPFDGVTRDTVIIMNPKNRNDLGFAFQLVNSNHFIDYATLNSYGTEQPVLSPQTVMEYKLPYSNNELDIKYSSLVKSYIDKVLELERENRSLTELRDFLLPMLMNGQATIED